MAIKRSEDFRVFSDQELEYHRVAVKKRGEEYKRRKIEEIKAVIRQDSQDLKLLSNFSTIGGTGDDLKFYRKFLSDIILNNIKDLRKILENKGE